MTPTVFLAIVGVGCAALAAICYILTKRNPDNKFLNIVTPAPAFGISSIAAFAGCLLLGILEGAPITFVAGIVITFCGMFLADILLS